MSNLTVTNVNGQNDLEGRAKAWANLNGTGTIALRDSFNISSTVDNGTGDYTFNYTNNFVNSGYSAVLTGCSSTNGFSLIHDIQMAPTTSAIRAGTYNSAGAVADAAFCTTEIHGGLA